MRKDVTQQYNFRQSFYERSTHKGSLAKRSYPFINLIVTMPTKSQPFLMLKYTATLIRQAHKFKDIKLLFFISKFALFVIQYYCVHVIKLIKEIYRKLEHILFVVVLGPICVL